ncbi:hypothetical protein RHOFW104T7_04030 [Rhodanobacter thiooxydans]|uniref:DUF4097 domain-containing protein n=1 Tax=Rhodanobacter thiooxydans TaxID=416169 RepID=A0A154QN93_9GAMM|nr:DUF4097 family beta strand repeat-containing protein [Rhodanobacter thiooxydans]EIL99713.1 hypothetical protein UUA_07969 [Rhodanobacter thiooxydans LCS2]KZC25308.1 hypothetical protein RHOFW104T7_04030 [Rhodanobacter thiooxydans]MCW0202375.1 DUF4097 family beta strand repeat-containing protein [Rhodanobacter thiooxydans]
MRRLLTAALLLSPLAAFAATPCKYEAARNLQLDLAGVRSVQVDVHSHDLHLTGSADAKGLSVRGRACASEQAALDKLQITQHREGDQLLIDIGNSGGFNFSLFGGSSYASLEATVQMPANLPVTVRVGSGDADVGGVQQLQASVGSGDLHVRQVAGKFATSVGSGDVDASDVGSLELGSVGSGDFKADGIKGDARIGSIGSGDVTLRNVGGSVHADTLGSGDLSVNDVGGDLSLGAKGSGDVNHSGVKGKVSVPHDND